MKLALNMIKNSSAGVQRPSAQLALELSGRLEAASLQDFCQDASSTLWTR